MYDHFYYIRLLVEFQCFRYSGILYVGTNIAARQIQTWQRKNMAKKNTLDKSLSRKGFWKPTPSRTALPICAGTPTTAFPAQTSSAPVFKRCMAEMQKKTNDQYDLPARPETKEHMACGKNQMRALRICFESDPCTEWSRIFPLYQTDGKQGLPGLRENPQGRI